MSQIPDIESFIFCNVGREAYAIDATRIVSVDKPTPLQHESLANELVGRFPGPNGDMPLYSLNRLLGRRASKPGGESQRVITLAQDGEHWALLAHSISPIIDIATDNIRPLPAMAQTPETSIFPAVIQHKGHLVLTLSLDLLYPNGIQAEPTPLPETDPIEDLAATEAADESALVALRATEQQPDGALILFYLPDQLVELKGLAFGLSMSQVAEIERIPPLIPIPKGPASVLGLSLWRDNVVPVVDLNYRLGLSSTAYLPSDGHSQLIVARGPQPGQLIGFPIQAGVRSLNAPIHSEPYEQSLPLNHQLVRGVFALSTETLVVPDLRRLMN